MQTTSFPTIFIIITFGIAGCGSREKERIPDFSPFDNDVAFLQKYSDVIQLTDSEGKSKIAVMGGLQARVMTSTAGAPDNLSYGWINKSFFASGDTSAHMNAFGGEERFWLGPEGGQFSIFFPKDSAFTFENWHTPEIIDLEAWKLVSQTAQAATFSKTARLVNYSGTPFDIRITRQIKVLDPSDAFALLQLVPDTTLMSVAYQTLNDVENTGAVAWSKKTGLLSIWLLGMYNPSDELTMVIPFKAGAEKTLGPIVNDDYFGKVPPDRLKVSDSVIFFRGDGKYRSKIGLNPKRATGVMGSYDGQSKTLTIVQYNKGEATDDYVNSKWELQKDPYGGDVANAYNDGPPAPGVKAMGPFYELESSSPAKELKPGEKVSHTQTTFHFQGDEKALDEVATKALGVSLAEIKEAFQ